MPEYPVKTQEDEQKKSWKQLITLPLCLSLASIFLFQAAKMGLTTGPVVAAWLLAEDDFQRIIWVSALAIVLISLTVWSPARLQDRLIDRK